MQPTQYFYVFLAVGKLALSQQSKQYSGWWFGTFFIFPYIGLLIIPIDSYFSEGWLKTTNLYSMAATEDPRKDVQRSSSQHDLLGIRPAELADGGSPLQH